MLLDLKPERCKRIEIVPYSLPAGSQIRERDKKARCSPETLEQRNVQGW
jgi:hypothetical protein